MTKNSGFPHLLVDTTESEHLKFLRKRIKHILERCRKSTSSVTEYYCSKFPSERKLTEGMKITDAEAEARRIVALAEFLAVFGDTLADRIQWDDVNLLDMLNWMFILGSRLRELEILDGSKPERLDGSGEFELNCQKSLQAIVGKEAVENERWAPYRVEKLMLILQAGVKWDAGSPLLHNEMADELLKENPKAAEAISKSVLLAALKPIAAKYGKVRGLKGIRKEKLPLR